ncbi:hypothetical protein GGG16DRAFT_52697 [Schizophyllum commune]|nr:hypothetical protein K525DRAFT_211304 [Schizophyllum commune Loenen D]
MTLALPPPAYSDKVDARRHTSYYFEDGNLTILASGVLFRVWSGLFRAPYSKAFAKMYPGFLAADDKTPLRLDRVSAKDFERFLWVLQPLTIGEFHARTVDDWIAVLELSTMWGFTDIREVAIKKLGSLTMDPVHKIVTQMRYDIERAWSLDAFDALCRRPKPLDIEEGERLGVEVLAKVASTREKLSTTWTKPKNIVHEAWLPSTHGPPVRPIFLLTCALWLNFVVD